MLNRKLLIGPDVSLKTALKQLDEGAERILFVVGDGGVLLGTLTDGDARRALLSGRSLDSGIEGIFNSKPIAFKEGEERADEARHSFSSRRITHIPIVDSGMVLTDVLIAASQASDSSDEDIRGEGLDLPVIIMAGGKGTRMAPFTNVLPKPLIPIGDKTIIELIMAEFARFGAEDFRLTLNYRGEMIRAYLEGSALGYKLSYVWEKDFLGTAGSIKLIENPGKTFIVSNCDIIVKADFREVAAFHERNHAALTVISSIQHHRVPYGVVGFGQGGRVDGIREKPEYSFPINTGVYVLDESCLDYIPSGRVFNMTDLIEALIAAGKPVYTFPVNEKEYLDIGQWEDYRRVVDLLENR
jgi:dTDP-glucose pyrophosphorylase